MKRVLIFIMLLSLTAAFPALATAAGSSHDYASVIDEIAEAYIGKTVPGACIMISEHGNVVFSKSYGYADVDMKKPIDPVSTVFEWGSITKTFVWVSVMQQVEAGRIDCRACQRSGLCGIRQGKHVIAAFYEPDCRKSAME
jgi:CubicO group peptidase (beta-lactamase class C family)